MMKKPVKRYTKLLSYQDMMPGVNLFERLFLSKDQSKIWVVTGFAPARKRKIYYIDEDEL